MLIGDIPRFNAERYGSRPAFKDERRTVSFAQPNEFIARALCGTGLQRADCAAVLFHNCTEYCRARASCFLRPEDYVLSVTPDELLRIGSAGRALRLTKVMIVVENGNEWP